MIRDLIDDYEKNFINLKNDLINEIEKLEIKNINLSDELKELQKKYDKLHLEFGEYKKKYNEETINELVKSRLEKIQSNNKYSLEEIKNYILSKSENVDILNKIEKIVANELEKENSKIYSEMLIRDILNYLYINRKDNILNNILMSSKSFIERSILDYDYTEENAIFAIEILKYYVLGMNKKVAIEWFKRIINSNMLNCLSDKNESVIVDLLYLSLYLEKDDVIFDNVDPVEIIVKVRKYDYLWYELYNKFIIKDEKIYDKFAILKLYYNEMYLIDNRVKQVCLSPIMKNIENLVSQYESRKTETKISRDTKSHKNTLINNKLKNTRNLDILEDYNKLIQSYISQNNIGLKEVINNIILNAEKVRALTRTEFITTIICGYICGINKLDLIRAMNIYKLDISCDSIFINRLLKNKNYLEYWNNNFSSLDIDEKVKLSIFNRINNITGFNQVKTNNSRLLSTEFDSKSLNEESQLKKLGYSSTISRSERENILKNKAIPQLGKARVRSHIEWLINMNKNKSTMKNSVIEWRYDLERLSRM